MAKKEKQPEDYVYCKYRNKRVIKTVNHLNELIKNYSKTNEKLNTLIIKKNKTKTASLLKSLTFFFFTRITSTIAIFFVVCFFGFLVGYHMSPKRALLHFVNQNFEAVDNEHAFLYKTEKGYVLRLDCIFDFTFDYNTIFMGTLVSSMMVYYYPSNNIGMSANEVCYSKENAKVNTKTQIDKAETASENNNALKKMNPRTNDTIKELQKVFEKFEKDESVIFLNSSSTSAKNSNITVTYMNDFLFSELNAYPIGGSDVAISAGILYGINYVNTHISVNNIFDNTNSDMLAQLLEDCKKGRIYIQLRILTYHIKTILFRVKPPKGMFLPFKINCKIVEGEIATTNNDFRSKVLQSYRIQRVTIHSINFFIL